MRDNNWAWFIGLGLGIIILYFLFMPQSTKKFTDIFKTSEVGNNELRMNLYDKRGNEILSTGTTLGAIVGGVSETESLNFEGRITNTGNIDFCAMTLAVFTHSEDLTPIKENLLNPMSGPTSMAPYWKSPLFYCTDQMHPYSIGWDLYTIGDPPHPDDSIDFVTRPINIEEVILKEKDVVSGAFKFRAIGYYGNCCEIRTMTDSNDDICQIRYKTDTCSDKVEIVLERTLNIEKEKAGLSVELN